MQSPELGAKERIALAFAVLLARGSMEFSSVRGSGSVYAESPTPNVLGTQIAGARATETALDKEKKDKDELARIQERINALLGTPTVTPTPNATVRAEATIDAGVAQRRAAIQATATADAIRSFTPTSTPRLPEIIPTPERTRESEGNSREIPWGYIAGGAATLVGGVYVVSRVRRNREERRREAHRRAHGIW